MLKIIQRQRQITAALLTGEFILFTIFIIFSPNLADGPGSSGIIVQIGLTALLFVAVLLTVFQYSKQIKTGADNLKEDLADQKKSMRTLQTQFEEAIEKRVYELQVINGALNREIGERTQAEEEIRDLQKQLSLILNSAGEGIFGLDNHGNVTFMNSAASLMVGWDVEELLGKSHHELIHHTHPDGNAHKEEDCPIYMAYRDGLVHYSSDDVFWCRNGSSFPVEYSSTPIRDHGMLSGAVVVFRDMATFK
ncbi:MAG: PAS domain-containing protein [Deltaproteobacteria bacterium]|nr:PAS domain-containing protein [Deltaproteobacteria bacterium]